MNKILDAFWRAAAYCLHPRVIALSILPLVVMAALSLGLGYFFWEQVVAWLRAGMDSIALVGTAVRWLESLGLANLQKVLVPMILLVLAVPVIVVVSLLFVALFMTPAMVSLVAERRFPQLERKLGASFFVSVLWSLGATLVAGLALVLSIPLWLVPPLILVLPPVIWGWLTYRVMAFDALANHASSQERKQVFQENRGALLGMGVLSGYLGAAPSVLWASGALFFALAPVLVPLAIWLYTLVFAFSSLWFAHYCLAALEQIRKQNTATAQVIPADAAPETIAKPESKPESKPEGLPPELPAFLPPL